MINLNDLQHNLIELKKNGNYDDWLETLRIYLEDGLAEKFALKISNDIIQAWIDG